MESSKRPEESSTEDLMIWNDVQEGFMFSDGSTVTQRHDTDTKFCYELMLKNHPKDVSGSLVLSEDHMLLCDVSKVKRKHKGMIFSLQPASIPKTYDQHVKLDEETGRLVYWDECVDWESCIVDKKKGICWLTAKTIYALWSHGQKVKVVGNVLVGCEPLGERECFCVATDTGKYECCGVTHHNSVALRNLMFHSLTHGDDIVLGLVDLKLTEFSQYKGLNNVVGVANTVQEATELLRMGREVMYARNAQNSERGLTDFADYKPKHPTKTIRIFGREFDEDYEFEVKVGGEEKKMTAKEILHYMGHE